MSEFRRVRARLRGVDGDAGNAVVEFLGVALLLLVPVVYLVLVLGRLQAATFAAEGAAREAGRSLVTAETAEEGRRAALASVRLALADQGFTDVDTAGALAVACPMTDCLAPGSDVEVRVTVEVPLPFVPGFVRDAVPFAIPVSATHIAPVDDHRAVP